MLCVSGFELYSLWVLLFSGPMEHNQRNNRTQQLQPVGYLQVQQAIGSLTRDYQGKIQRVGIRAGLEPEMSGFQCKRPNH